MAGGTFLVQNKVRAGAYINFRSGKTISAAVGERGIASVPLALGFGAEKKIVAVNADTDVKKTFGYAADSAELLLLRECAKRAKTVLVYRLNGGTKASCIGGDLTATAKYSGTRGNDLTVKISAAGAKFKVDTYVDGVLADSQEGAAAGDLAANDWVVFSGSGALTIQAGMVLSGGGNAAVTAADYDAYFRALALENFQTLAVPCADTAIQSAAVQFVKRMREDEGKKIQAVLASYPQAGYEGVISVKNGVVLENGTAVSKEQATAFVAGMTAGAQVNESNTYGVYDGASDVDSRYLNSEIIAALQAGEWLFIPRNGKVVVEQDRNTLTAFSPEKGEAFSKNRLIRVMDSLAEDVKTLFEEKYLGKAENSADGRNLFQAELLAYLGQLEDLGAIEAFDAQGDVEVLAGNTADAVIVNLILTPVDSMEKLYMTVKIG